MAMTADDDVNDKIGKKKIYAKGISEREQR